MIDHARITQVLGDRLLVRRLDRHEKQKGLWLPAERVAGQVKENVVWWGVIEGFGLDTRYGDAYGLFTGDVVGFLDLGGHSDAFECEDGATRLFVPEEFACVKDSGLVAAMRSDQPWDCGKSGPGLSPVGPFLLVRPKAREEKRNGVVVPHKAQGQPREGTVMALSTGYLEGGDLHRHEVEAGQEVLFGPYAGCWARFPEAEFFLIKGGRGEQVELRAVLEPVGEREVVHA